MFDCLTGFKWIAAKEEEFEKAGTNNYVFGLEESYGCLAGTHARDKDAIVAVMCLCEVAAWCKSQGITVWDQMQKIYKQYGYYMEGIHTITLKGIDGARQIKDMMDRLRADPPKEFDGLKVLKFRDYTKDTITDLETGEVTPTGLPASNVLYFDIENDSWCCARPSGTEPKIKFYMGIKGNDLKDAESKLESFKKAVVDALEG